MEFDSYSLAFQGDQHIVRWDAERIKRLNGDDFALLGNILDVFGKKSAVAQALGAPVTDIYRLRSTDQRLYMYMYRQSNKTVVLGGLKVGTKKLFMRTVTGDLREIQPVCILDFYVHESCQRKGIGKELFEYFLQSEGFTPANLAYDRPSPKLIGFLKKHYGLKDYVPQANNYVLFNQYWEFNPTAGMQTRGGVRGGGAGGNIHPLGPSRGSSNSTTPFSSPPPPLPPASRPAYGMPPYAPTIQPPAMGGGPVPSPLLNSPTRSSAAAPGASPLPGGGAGPGADLYQAQANPYQPHPQPSPPMLPPSQSFGQRWAQSNFGAPTLASSSSAAPGGMPTGRGGPGYGSGPYGSGISGGMGLGGGGGGGGGMMGGGVTGRSHGSDGSSALSPGHTQSAELLAPPAGPTGGYAQPAALPLAPLGAPSYGAGPYSSGVGGGPGGYSTAVSSSPNAAGALGDTLDAFAGRSYGGPPGSSMAGQRGGMTGTLQQDTTPGRPQYHTRPPWALDEPGPGSTTAGVTGATPPRRGRMDSLTPGGPAGFNNILPGDGPHARALQQQLASMQLGSPARGGAPGAYRQGAGTGSGQQQQQGYTTPAASAATTPNAKGGTTPAHLMAVAQRSGAGAADCLVW